jgi:hypothetical protein
MMNFHDSDALGGLIEGNKARMSEDTVLGNQQLTLAQIAETQGRNSRAEQEMLMRKAEEARKAELHPMDVKKRETEQSAADLKLDRDKTAAWLDERGRIAGAAGPGELMTIDQKYGMAGHPLVQIHENARKASAGFVPTPERPISPEQMLYNQVAGGDMASRDKAEQARLLDQRQILKDTAAGTRNAADNAARVQVATIAAQARREVAALDAAAKAAGALTQDKYIVSLQRELDAAELKQDVAGIARAKDKIEQAKGIMMDIATASTTEKGQNATARARALGIEVPDYQPRTAPKPPGAATATPPTAGPALPPGVRRVTPPAAAPVTVPAEAVRPVSTAPVAPPAQAAPPVAAAPRPANNARMAQSPADFPRVTEDQQRGRNEEAIAQMEHDVKQYAADLNAMPANHPDRKTLEELIRATGIMIQHRRNKVFNPIPGM